MRLVILAGLGLAIYALIAVATEHASEKMRQKDQLGHIIASRFGFRAALDTLQLAMIWLLLHREFSVPSDVPFGNLSVPIEYIYIFVFALIMALSYRVRLWFHRE